MDNLDPRLKTATTNLSGTLASAGLTRMRSLTCLTAIESQLDSLSEKYTKEKATHMLIDALRKCMEEVTNDFADIITHLGTFGQVWAAIRSDMQEISQRLALGPAENISESMVNLKY